MTLTSIEGSITKNQERLAEIDIDMQALTHMMYDFASGDKDLGIPISDKI